MTINLQNFKKQWAVAAQNPNITLTAEHHVLYNILREYDVDRGFTPTTKASKLANGHSINAGLHSAIHNLKMLIDWANRLIDNPDKVIGTTSRRVLTFLDTLDNGCSLEQLASVQVPVHAEIYSNFGIGKQIADKIIDEELTQLTFSDIKVMELALSA